MRKVKPREVECLPQVLQEEMAEAGLPLAACFFKCSALPWACPLPSLEGRSLTWAPLPRDVRTSDRIPCISPERNRHRACVTAFHKSHTGKEQ